MGFPEESVVAIVKELVYCVVLGFCKPPQVTVKGVPTLVYAPVENALSRLIERGLVEDVVINVIALVEPFSVILHDETEELPLFNFT